MGAGPDSAPVVKIILCIDYFAPTNQREAWTGVGWTGVSAASVVYIRINKYQKVHHKCSRKMSFDCNGIEGNHTEGEHKKESHFLTNASYICRKYEPGTYKLDLVNSGLLYCAYMGI